MEKRRKNPFMGQNPNVHFLQRLTKMTDNQNSTSRGVSLKDENDKFYTSFRLNGKIIILQNAGGFLNQIEMANCTLIKVAMLILQCC